MITGLINQNHFFVYDLNNNNNFHSEMPAKVYI